MALYQGLDDSCEGYRDSDLNCLDSVIPRLEKNATNQY